MSAKHIFTIGYEQTTQAEFIARLKAAGVRRVIDVRARPISRKPGFSKNVLAASLAAEGIAYVGLKALGTPPEGRAAALDRRRDDLERIYAGQLETTEAVVASEQLKELAAEQPSALLCFERDPSCCHRTLLREAVLGDWTVTDLFV